MSNDYKDYICRSCGQTVLATSTPTPIRWTDGHVCRFVLEQKGEDNDKCVRKDD